MLAPRVGLRAQQIAGWAGIALLIALLIAATSRGMSTEGLIDLSGKWTATADRPQAWRGTLDVPGLFANQGLDPAARVRLERDVSLPDDGTARSLWIEAPQYAVRVEWDGVPLYEQGAPDGTNVRERTETAALVDLPNGAGVHRLALDVRGDGRKGGVAGRVLIGPRAATRAAWLRSDAERIGLAMMLAMLGVLHLGVATRPQRRPAYVYFGLFAGALSAWAFTQSDISAAAIPDFVLHTRLRRVVNAMTSGFGTAFVSTFLYGRLTRPPIALLAVGSLGALASIALPFDDLYRVEQAMDAAMVAALFWFLGVTIDAVRTRTRWATLLLVATAPPLAAGALADILLSHGLIGGSTWVYPSLAWFCGGCSIALAVRHADEAARHERLLDGSVDAIVTIDRDGRIRDANPAARLILDAPTGRPIERWVRPEDRPIVRAHLARGLQALDRAEVRVVLGPRRELIMDSIATPIARNLALVVLRDVTVRRKMDHGMLQAARMEMMGAVASGIAHDFNNMLGTLLAQVGLLQSGGVGPKEQATLGRMERAIERASVLIRRLLTAAGGTSSGLEALPIGPVCHEAAELVQVTLPRGVHLVVDVPEGPLIALASAPDLEQILVNLLMNARDAVGEAGTITVRARPYRLGGVSGVGIIVEDDGPGVPDAAKTEIFEPFVTTKPAGKGTGLGLAVCAKVLRDHDGRIWVEDRPGGGARFVVALRGARATEEEGLPRGRQVVLVEDEAALRETFAGALGAAGYAVRAFDGGAPAIAALRGQRPDILVTDVLMPGISGIEVAQACQGLYDDVPILLVSGFIPDDALAALQAGAWYRLDKPVRASRLVATVGRIRRRIERRARGEAEITDVSMAMPALTGLTAADLLA